MTSLPGRRRRNTLLAMAAGLACAVLAPTLMYVGAKAISNSKAGKNARGNSVPEQAFPQTPTAMLATVNDSNELTSVTVFVLAPDSDVSAAVYDQRGGSIVSVPVNSDTGSGDQLLSLHDAYALGGVDELASDLESAISLTIDFSAVMKAAELAALLTGLPAVDATLPRDVLGSDGAPIFPKGPNALTAVQVAQILTTKSPTESERLRQPNVDALWAGMAAAIGSGRTDQTLSVASPASFAEMAARLMAGPVAARGLVARPLEPDRNPEGLDIEGLDRSDTILVFASIAPAQMTRPASGPSYRIEAPPGYDLQVRRTIAVLLSTGGNVVSVDLSAKPKEETTFIIYDSVVAAAQPTDNDVFGKIKVETPDVRLGGVDETIVLGTTYLGGVDLTAPEPTTSTLVAVTETTG